MTNENPYAFDDNVDADLFSGIPQGGTPEREELINRAFEKLSGMSNVPLNEQEKLRQKLYDLLSSLPTSVLQNVELVVATLTNNESMIEHFSEFVMLLETLNPHGPLLRIMAEVLDKMTNGLVRRRWRLYRCQQLLYASHHCLKGVNNMMQEATSDNAPDEVINLLDNLMQSLLNRIHGLTERYRELAAEEDLIVDESLINNGTYTSETLDDLAEFTTVTVFEVALNHMKASKYKTE